LKRAGFKFRSSGVQACVKTEAPLPQFCQTNLLVRHHLRYPIGGIELENINMKFTSGAASLLALTLFVLPVAAQEAITDQTKTDQAAPATETANAAIPDDVLALLADARTAPELTEEELLKRAKIAARFAADETLPEDVRGQLKTLAEAAKAELETRQQAQQTQKQEEIAPIAEAPKEDPAPAPVEAVIPDDVLQLLNDNQNLADMDGDSLKQKAKLARHLAKNTELPQDVRDKLNAIAQDARIEITKRETQIQQAQPEVAPAPEPAPAQEPQAIVQEAPPQAPVETVQPVVIEPPPAPPAKADVQALDANTGDPASEKQAHAYLNDQTALDSLSDDELRNRLDNIRDVMASNELSRDTERAVRTKLKGERDILRQRLAAKEIASTQKTDAAQAAPPPPPPAISTAALPPAPPTPPPPASNITVTNIQVITNITPTPVVLGDRRPPEELQVSELQRRLQVYNDVQNDEDYDQANRDYWRASMARDREILRRRMVAERRRRAEELAMQASTDGLDIEINLTFSNNRPPPPRYVFAAEVDDQELEDVLVAPPRRSIKQRFNSVDEIAAQPRLRDSVSRIEIDTIRFGYNEAFVREEQLQSLDGIAAIIERIVKKYPNEVFLIEGHTDAPGSNAYNAKLSKLRAEAIKKALVSYYVIPPQNLRTVGLGERFLKIPTADAEPENRRVSISRITPLLSGN
jgi:outer membrane protein OmpA-like peptidoglycan-associated protein